MDIAFIAAAGGAVAVCVMAGHLSRAAWSHIKVAPVSDAWLLEQKTTRDGRWT